VFRRLFHQCGALRFVLNLTKRAIVRPVEFRAMAQNWEAAVEMPAFIQRPLADLGVLRQAAEDLGAVDRAVLVQQQVFVDQPAGLVVGAHPGRLDVPPPGCFADARSNKAHRDEAFGDHRRPPSMKLGGAKLVPGQTPSCPPPSPPSATASLRNGDQTQTAGVAVRPDAVRSAASQPGRLLVLGGRGMPAQTAARVGRRRLL